MPKQSCDPLYSPFKTSVRINGKRYEIRPSWDRVLEAYDTIADDLIPYQTRVKQVAYLLFWSPPKDRLLEAVGIALKFLERREDDSPKEEAQAEPQYYDFKQDAKYIYGAFWQTYGIRLTDWRDTRKKPTDKTQWMHWHEFLYLFASLPEDTRMSWIMGIRSAEIPRRTEYNGESVDRLMRQKAAFRLDVSEEDGAARFARGANMLFDKLEAQARNGKKRRKT